jgi:hypothetical protein
MLSLSELDTKDLLALLAAATAFVSAVVGPTDISLFGEAGLPVITSGKADP